MMKLGSSYVEMSITVHTNTITYTEASSLEKKILSKDNYKAEHLNTVKMQIGDIPSMEQVHAKLYGWSINYTETTLCM